MKKGYESGKLVVFAAHRVWCTCFWKFMKALEGSDMIAPGLFEKQVTRKLFTEIPADDSRQCSLQFHTTIFAWNDKIAQQTRNIIKITTKERRQQALLCASANIMCGIVGCIGHDRIQNCSVKRIRKALYRGYDQQIIYYGRRWINTISGNVLDVVFKIRDGGWSYSSICRDWAYSLGNNGPADRKQRSPHQSQSGRFTLVHNGVIENYDELKKNT